MCYASYRGLSHVSKWVKRKFAVMNLKKLAVRRWKDRLLPRVYVVFMPFGAKRVFSLALEYHFLDRMSPVSSMDTGFFVSVNSGILFSLFGPYYSCEVAK